MEVARGVQPCLEHRRHPGLRATLHLGATDSVHGLCGPGGPGPRRVHLAAGAQGRQGPRGRGPGAGRLEQPPRRALHLPGLIFSPPRMLPAGVAAAGLGQTRLPVGACAALGGLCCHGHALHHREPGAAAHAATLRAAAVGGARGRSESRQDVGGCWHGRRAGLLLGAGSHSARRRSGCHGGALRSDHGPGLTAARHALLAAPRLLRAASARGGHGHGRGRRGAPCPE
mmetsp:Transcript_13627/g.43090  ORF Transcript_13627/g.43090 Transcript_13627/m.43090 type:complete len:228 (+) Transcript_13627:226-909(+)